MSVYRAAKSPHWQYDFWVGGNRFRGSFDGLERRQKITLERPKRDAERAEAVIRSTAGQPRGTEKPRLTLQEAASRYWTEAAQEFAEPTGEFGRLRNLQRLLGKHTMLDGLDDARLSQFVAKRRMENARNKKTLVAPATLNRELECLGRILKRARRLWGVLTPPELSVTAHKLKEPKERVRSLTGDEDVALFKAIDKIRPDFRDMVEFALITGKRLSEVICLEKRKVDRRAMEARVIQKGGQEIVISLTTYSLAILDRNWMHHKERVFTYICQKNRVNRRKAKRYPFTADGWRKPWKAILKEASITDFRFHDLRHTALTRILAATGNLRAVQDAADHRSIVSTARYAHTDSKQRRAALESAERLRIPDKVPETESTSAKNRNRPKG